MEVKSYIYIFLYCFVFPFIYIFIHLNIPYLIFISFLIFTCAIITVQYIGLLKFKSNKIIPLGNKYNEITCIIVAYLPNEQEQIFKTLEHFKNYTSNLKINIIVAYNTNIPLPLIENKLNSYSSEKILILNILNSKSKAENINACLGLIETEIVCIFDTDSNPILGSLEIALNNFNDNTVDIIQGHISIRNYDKNILTHIVACEYDLIYSIYHKGFYNVYNYAIFGGSNGYFRTKILQTLKLNSDFLTEDIDLSFRSLILNYKCIYNDEIISTELSPLSMDNYMKQRLRWSQGWFQVSKYYLFKILFSNLSFRYKLGTFFILGWREFYFHIPFQLLGIICIYFYKNSYIEINAFFSITCYSILLFMIQLYILKSNKKYWILFIIPYQFLQIFIGLIGQFREFNGYKKWNITKREGI